MSGRIRGICKCGNKQAKKGLTFSNTQGIMLPKYSVSCSPCLKRKAKRNKIKI